MPFPSMFAWCEFILLRYTLYWLLICGANWLSFTTIKICFGLNSCNIRLHIYKQEKILRKKFEKKCQSKRINENFSFCETSSFLHSLSFWKPSAFPAVYDLYIKGYEFCNIYNFAKNFALCLRRLLKIFSTSDTSCFQYKGKNF